MKTLTILILALTLFSCSKESLTEPTFKNEAERPRTTKVNVHCFGWMANYNLKYKRISGWVDTTINTANYSFQFECLNQELSMPVTITTIERYDKDTLRLKVTVNTTISQQAIINKCDAQCLLQPNNAL